MYDVNKTKCVFCKHTKMIEIRFCIRRTTKLVKIQVSSHFLCSTQFEVDGCCLKTAEYEVFDFFTLVP